MQDQIEMTLEDIDHCHTAIDIAEAAGDQDAVADLTKELSDLNWKLATHRRVDLFVRTGRFCTPEEFAQSIKRA